MNIHLEQVLPQDIEARSFAIITQELQERNHLPPDPLQAPILKRVIHTSADFDYADNLVFSPGAVEHALQALQNGAAIVTDTNMAKSGINQAALRQLNTQVHCFMADEDVANAAREPGTTRAMARMEKAARLPGPLIFAIGNAPTALVRLYELIQEGAVQPELVIGVPVGFVNVVESKELILSTTVPHIVARGRKGGSNIAAAICNALLYQLTKRE